MRFLIVEDDLDTAKHIIEGLTRRGHATAHAASGTAGLKLAESERFDAIVLDRMLPELDGLTVVAALRAAGVATPALILTHLSGVDDRVEGLEAGGDDYLVKPCAFEELMARLMALARRPTLGESPTRLAAGDLEMDLIARSVKRGGEPIELQPREFELLKFFLQSEGRIVTRTMLLEKVWSFHFDPRTNIVETHISRLRAKIDKGRAASFIETIRGAGYAFRA